MTYYVPQVLNGFLTTGYVIKTLLKNYVTIKTDYTSNNITLNCVFITCIRLLL